MKKILVALAILPLAAFAQGAGPAPGSGPGGRSGTGPGAGGRPDMGPGPGPGPAGRPDMAPGTGGGRGMGHGMGQGDPARGERRMRVARTLGLAEALDLEPAQALKLGDVIGRFDERRQGVHKQQRDAKEVLRRAAMGEKVAPAEVDQAIQKALEARTQLQAIDREIVAAVTKELTPEKKARAVLFLERFQGRFGPGGRGGGMMMDGQRHGGMGGMGKGGHGGMGMDHGGMGMGQGGMGMGGGMCPHCQGHDDEE